MTSHSRIDGGAPEFQATQNHEGSPQIAHFRWVCCFVKEQTRSRLLFETDTQRGVATGLSRGRNLRSKI